MSARHQDWTIRQANAVDLDALAAIEIDAYPTYAASVGQNPADAHATPRHLMEEALADGVLLIAEAGGDPIGFVACHVREHRLHIGEIDVRRDWQRQGVGRALMQRALREVGARGLRGAMLTTDRFAPFNAPFYASLGFREVADGCLPCSLRDALSEEIARGHDPGRRVGMIWDVPQA